MLFDIFNIMNFKRFINDSVPEVDANVNITSYAFNKKIVEYTFAEGLGLVKMKNEPYQVNYYSIDNGGGASFIQDRKYFNGISRELVRFNVQGND